MTPKASESFATVRGAFRALWAHPHDGAPLPGEQGIAPTG